MGEDRERFRKPFRATPIHPGPAYLAQARNRRTKQTVLLASAVFLGVFGGGLLLTKRPAVSALFASSASSPQFEVCGLIRETCVVDGDTFWLDGEKFRIADIDTPEISEPRCASEYSRGIEARDRLVVLLNEAPFDLQPIGGRDLDQYGRKLRVAVRGGRSIGDQLVSEGLARTWTGRRGPWC